MSYDPYSKYGDPFIAHAQVIYLYRVKHFDYSRIADITGYAVSTVRGYVYKYEGLYEKATQMFVEPTGVVPPHIKGNWCYWIRVYCDGRHIFDKIGTTTRSPVVRINEVMRNGWKYYDGVLTCTVMELIDCGSRNPVGLEKLLHGVLISQDYKHIPNDRFEAALDRDLIINTAKMYGYYAD